MKKLPTYVVINSYGGIEYSYDKEELLEAIKDGDVDEHDEIYLLTEMTKMKFSNEIKLFPAPVVGRPSTKKKK